MLAFKECEKKSLQRKKKNPFGSEKRPYPKYKRSGLALKVAGRFGEQNTVLFLEVVEGGVGREGVFDPLKHGQYSQVS